MRTTKFEHVKGKDMASNTGLPPPPPSPEGGVGHAVECVEKQIYATAEAIAEVYRRLERVLVPDETTAKTAVAEFPPDPRASPLTNSITILDYRLAGVRTTIEELLRRINL